VFGEGGGKRTAEAMGVPFLGELPLDPAIRIGGDTGSPIALRGKQDSQAADIFTIANRVVEALQQTTSRQPTISITE
jgi:ATP-binding protein involved in chromosome partitioning